MQQKLRKDDRNYELAIFAASSSVSTRRKSGKIHDMHRLTSLANSGRRSAKFLEDSRTKTHTVTMVSTNNKGARIETD